MYNSLQKFHPLHVMPSDALGTLPRPLLRLIYPAQVDSRSPSPTRSPSPPPAVYDPTISRSTNLSAAEKLREQMRRDMLSQLGGDDEENVRFSFKPPTEAAKVKEEEQKGTKGYEGVDWESMVSGTKKVLTMDVGQVSLHKISLTADQNPFDILGIAVTPRALVLFLVRIQVQFT